MSLDLSAELASIQRDYPKIYEALIKVQNVVNQGHAVAGVNPAGTANTPVNNGMLAINQDSGIYDAVISDPAADRGEHYFLQWDTTPSFSTARTIYLGPTRSWRGALGAVGKTYWRHQKQLLGSNISDPVNFGGDKPMPVQANNAIGGPTPGVPQGSGSSKVSGHGWGPIGATK